MVERAEFVPRPEQIVEMFVVIISRDDKSSNEWVAQPISGGINTALVHILLCFDSMLRVMVL